jgi:Flp pilus assembly protein TadD
LFGVRPHGPGGQGHPEEAVGYCRAAVALRPSSAEALCLLGSALAGKGDFDAALLAIRQGRTLDPKSMSARHHWNATLCAMMGRNPKAALARLKELEAEARAAIHLKPNDYLAHYDLGLLLLDQGRSKEAEAAFREALRLNPDDHLAHDNYGCVLGDQGRHKEAEAAFREAIRLDPSDTISYHRLMGTLAAQGRYKEAEAECREVVRLHPDDPWLHNGLGNLLSDQGRYKEAETAYREAIRLKHDDHGFHYRLGIVLSNQGRTKEAEAAYREAIRIKPDDVYAQNTLAWWLATCPDSRLRDPEQAVVHAKKAVELKPSDGNLWKTLGVAQYRKGDWKAAIEALMKSGQIRKGSDSFDFFFLAMAHWQLNEKEKARAWYDQAIAWMDKNSSQNEELKRFRDEAAALLGLAKATESQKKND